MSSSLDKYPMNAAELAEKYGNTIESWVRIDDGWLTSKSNFLSVLKQMEPDEELVKIMQDKLVEWDKLQETK